MPHTACLVVHLLACCALAAASLYHGPHADIIKAIAYATLALAVACELRAALRACPKKKSEKNEKDGDSPPAN